MANQGVHPHGGNRAEQQAENPAHDRHWDTLQQCAELTDKCQADSEDRCPGHDFRVVVLGQHHGARHFGVGGIGWAAQQACGGGGNAVTEQRAMQPRLFQVVTPSHAAYSDNAADMFNGRGQGHGDDKQNRLPVELRCCEVRQGKPGGRSDLGGVDDAKVERQRKTYQDAGNDRHQTENPFTEDRHDQCGQQRWHRDQHGGLVVDQFGAVFCPAHCHMCGNRGHCQTDRNNHRANHHWWQQAINETGALNFYGEAKEGVHETGCHYAAHGRGEAELALGENDGGNEGETRSQKDRHLAPGNDLEQQSPETRREQRDVRVQACNQRHQHQRAKGHEEHLRARNNLAPERVVELVLHVMRPFAWCRRSCRRHRPSPE